jgi:hypothetical protein
MRVQQILAVVVVVVVEQTQLDQILELVEPAVQG